MELFRFSNAVIENIDRKALNKIGVPEGMPISLEIIEITLEKQTGEKQTFNLDSGEARKLATKIQELIKENKEQLLGEVQNIMEKIMSRGK